MRTRFGTLTLIAVFAAAIFTTSCSKHYRCGTPEAQANKKSGNKRYRAAIAERDSLCSVVTLLKGDTMSIGAQKRARDQEYADLSRRYEALRRNATSELAMLNKDLQAREMHMRQLEAALMRQDSIMNALTATVRNALLGFSAEELTVEMRNGKVYVSMSDKLLFQSGSDQVEAKGKEALAKLASVLNKNADINILVEGHTDNVPIKTARYKDNWDLSGARATSVIRILQEEHNVSPRRLTASGKGEFAPVAVNETAEGRQKNRRTEIILSPKLDELMKVMTANTGR